MPTLSKPQLTDPESPWGGVFDQMNLELSSDRIVILTALGFYVEHDLSPPENSDAIVTKDEEEELRQIANALTVAAAASAVMPPGVLIASLQKVSKDASLFFTRELAAPVEWAMACDYQRAEEPAGTHWRDVWADQVAATPGEIEQPTESNITKAARAAIATIQERRRPGRPYNPAHQILADRLGEIFRRTGQSIRRRREPVMPDPAIRTGAAIYVESGPFYDFLDLVLKPLRRSLREQRLAPVNTETIVRLVTEEFPVAD
jgi:hypothetical protein